MGKKNKIVIIGGGPSGASLGCYLALQNIPCLVLEKECFPRDHVGESLLPSCHKVLRDIGLLEKIDKERFPKKYGATWKVANTSKIYTHDFKGFEDEARIRFDENKKSKDQLLYTFHVNRARFDEILLRHAESLGCEVEEEAVVLDVVFSEESAEVIYKKAGEKIRIETPFVVDASGQKTFLGQKKGLKIKDPLFNQCALFSWFNHKGHLDEEKQKFIKINMLPDEKSWIWEIPISKNIVSVGLIGQQRDFPKTKKKWEEFFWEKVNCVDELSSLLKQSTRVKDFRVEADYSYEMKDFCGHRFALIGDAARFVDPIFSSGVSVALNSARLLSYDLIPAWKEGVFSRDKFTQYEKKLKRATSHWYRFINAYYRLNVLFTFFVNRDEERLEILKYIQGEVYDEEDEGKLLLRMEQMIEEVEKNKLHPWHNFLDSFSWAPRKREGKK